MIEQLTPQARQAIEAGIDRVALIDPAIVRETLVLRIATLPLDQAAARLAWTLLQDAKAAGELHLVAEDRDTGVGVWRAGSGPQEG